MFDPKNKDTWTYNDHMMEMMVDSQCLKCRKYSGNMKCQAFEDIPADILNNDHDHRVPFDGESVLFEAVEESGAV